ASSPVRRWVLTISVATITATAAWYGAGLKYRQEFSQEHRKLVEASSLEKVQQLEKMRTKLVRQRSELQSKVDRLLAKS
ncbi:hypothetical protein K431DRAFT_211795, partial [Polychaeton citri CBS 116435]